MRGHDTRLRKLDRSIAAPQLMTLDIAYANGSREANLLLDAALPPGQGGHVQVKHGSTVLMGWLPIELWSEL